jgi:pilus assembly protein CpaD
MLQSATDANPAPFRWRLAAVAAVLVCAAGLAGCNWSRHEIVGAVPDDYRTRHPIVLDEDIAVLDIPIGPGGSRLAPDSYANVMAFGDRFRRSGSPVIAVVTPRGSPNEQAARRSAGEIQAALASSGIPAQAISVRSYAATSRDTTAPIRLAYSRVVARTDQCGQWPDQLTNNSENRNYHNFGCATQQNLAAIVENPLDLVYPRDSAPPDAGRRGTVLENYRQGTATQSDYGRESGGQISGVGG